MQINCNRCHRYEKETPGAPYINRAKEVVDARGCRACHVINGRGGNLGPDLTMAGDKSPEQFNYDRIRGFHSEFTWQVAHMKNPKELVPESVMPNFNFSSRDAQALSMLVITPRRRSTAQGINTLASHLLGDAFSPPLIGALVDFTLAKSGCADESPGQTVDSSSWIGSDMQAAEHQDARCVDRPCSWGNNITGSCCWDVSQTACTNSARSQASAYQLWLYLTLPMVIVAFFCFLAGARRQQADHAAMKIAVETGAPQHTKGY